MLKKLKKISLKHEADRNDMAFEVEVEDEIITLKRIHAGYNIEE